MTLPPPAPLELHGRQEPRLCNTPGTAVSSAGAEVVALAKSAGLILDPWQQFIIEVMLGERADGKWAAREVGYLVARQNGKGGILDALGLGALFLFDDEVEILHSAHEFKTAKKAYRMLKSWIQGAPHLLAEVERRGSRVVGFRNSNEDTSITLRNGKVCRFMARSNNTGRGFSSQRLIVDEAQECSEETRQALQYIVSAQKNPQLVFVGTVPSERNNGEVWKSLRDRGRKGGDSTLAWMEWNPPEDVDPLSVDAAEWANPGAPYRITLETVEAERNAATTPEALAGYIRERISVWPDDDEGADSWRMLDKAGWAAGSIERPLDDDALPAEVTFTIEAPPDRSYAVIACATGEAGAVTVEIVRREEGVGWLVDAVLGIQARRSPKAWMLDPRSPVATEARELEAAGVEFVELDTQAVARAQGSFRDAVKDGEVRHFGQPELTESAAKVVGRKYGETLLMDRWNGPATEVIAASLARWGHLEIEGPKSWMGYEERGLVVLG